jgi:hypothetical protein
MTVGLPQTARERLQGIARGEPWSSEQSVGEDVVLRRLGFAPAGVVIGSVFSYTFYPTVPPGYKHFQPALGFRPVWIDDPMTARASGGYVHDWAVREGGQQTWDMGWTWERMYHEGRERRVAEEAISNLVAEAKAVGAHGVINIDFAVTSYGLRSLQPPAYPVFEMRVKGTAVRVSDHAPDSEPFTTALSASEIWKLAGRGYIPTRFVVGIGCVCGQLGSSTRRRLRSLSNREVDQFSEVTHHSMRIAREDIERHSAAKGELILGATPKLEVEREGGLTYDVTTRITGSVVRRFRRFGSARPLDFMPVVPASDAP